MSVSIESLVSWKAHGYQNRLPIKTSVLIAGGILFVTGLNIMEGGK